MPDLPAITPAQWKASVGVLATVLTTMFGFDLNDRTQAILVTVLVGAWAAFGMLSDAVIRHGRATGVGVELARQVPPIDAPALAPDAPDTADVMASPVTVADAADSAAVMPEVPSS